MENKIGLVGFGYWGKILYKNLIGLGVDVVVCEPNYVDTGVLRDYTKLESDYTTLNVDKVFVAVPATFHHEVVKHFLSNGVDVFCEKPLGMTTAEVDEMYTIAKNNNCGLFVDWLFTFNMHANAIIDMVNSEKYGQVKSISMNFLNKGPVRYDCNAKYDLASHYVSIVQKMFGVDPSSSTWINYRRDTVQAEQDDSCVGSLTYGKVSVFINASWEHAKKNREVIVTFADDSYLNWDDMTGKITYTNNTSTADIEIDAESPLKISIESFLGVRDFSYIEQEQLTRSITKILEND